MTAPAQLEERKEFETVRVHSATKRVLEVMAHLDPALGGISTVVPRLAGELVNRSLCDAELCVFERASEQQSCSVPGQLRMTNWPASRTQWLTMSSLRSSFRQLLARADVVHIHGLWETSTTAASRLAQAAGRPCVISAHGMLEPWALANKATKKRVYAALLERGNLQRAACLHALTSDEAEDYRRFGCTQPIAIIPNGVDQSEVNSCSAEAFLDRHPVLRGQRILLFLGRIHFKKGLDLLIPAWAALAGRFPDAVLVLAGPDSEDSRTGVEDLIAHHGIKDRVLFTGMLDAAMKWSALAAATCFVLPSYSEGLSVALLEALSTGVPVICSEQCHLPEVLKAGAGWVIKTDRLALEGALAQVLENGAEANRAIGRRGQQLAKANRWETVAGQMAELYGWVDGGPRPVSFPLRSAGQ